MKKVKKFNEYNVVNENVTDDTELIEYVMFSKVQGHLDVEHIVITEEEIEEMRGEGEGGLEELEEFGPDFGSGSESNEDVIKYILDEYAAEVAQKFGQSFIVTKQEADKIKEKLNGL